MIVILASSLFLQCRYDATGVSTLQERAIVSIEANERSASWHNWHPMLASEHDVNLDLDRFSSLHFKLAVLILVQVDRGRV